MLGRSVFPPATSSGEVRRCREASRGRGSLADSPAPPRAVMRRQTACGHCGDALRSAGARDSRQRGAVLSHTPLSPALARFASFDRPHAVALQGQETSHRSVKSRFACQLIAVLRRCVGVAGAGGQRATRPARPIAPRAHVASLRPARGGRCRGHARSPAVTGMTSEQVRSQLADEARSEDDRDRASVGCCSRAAAAGGITGGGPGPGRGATGRQRKQQ